MDNSLNFDWLNTDGTMMSTLLGLNQMPDGSPQKEQATTSPQQHITPSFEPSMSMVQNDDNFLTISTAASISKPMSKKKFKEPIFVTELPQNAYNSKKKKKSDSSSDSEDEGLGGSYKAMTSKERRQLRNKISARNFRVRRKEYITQLEQKVECQEKTIESLKEENEKLRKANDELMQQLLSQPITQPSSSGLTSDDSTTSASEGQSSPEPLSSMPFQFPLDELYDFSLFDQVDQQSPQYSQQQQQQLSQPNAPFSLEQFSSFYLHHVATPDVNIGNILNEKFKDGMTQEERRTAASELLSEYPLLGAALMSIILRHTMTLEYVTSIASEYSGTLVQTTDRLKEQETPIDSKRENTKHIEYTPEEIDEYDPRLVTDEELLEYILCYHLSHYVFMRTKGLTHQETMKRWRKCFDERKSCMDDFWVKMRGKEKKKSSGSKYMNGSLRTLQTYCKVAGAVLKNPQRMTQIHNVLKENIRFTDNEHTRHAERRYASLIGPFKNLRISSN
ncbi:hypothetical protein BCV72DRAFT_62022 [Rhizopus microsporus var. microsporus]|uniref:BZIP domain-containing protein n=2 Tax=Rhizopus microsporus TaxID=58291 RepID=A0A2G4SKU7_RHIZD|nr:uncharacterized protein RHIMIDRAFT_246334 [Rhizopus microsporus ATCC 52813]ORE09539.1 hypothetical protein BCV72DRAFT_62022 [Rhizopus microsporus var. microsporus]PHZ09383.1 hypothetical protein RHIMIDRAFT_246334 [Rhizopus microsporus ATCC 52813]